MLQQWDKRENEGVSIVQASKKQLEVIPVGYRGVRMSSILQFPKIV